MRLLKGTTVVFLAVGLLLAVRAVKFDARVHKIPVRTVHQKDSRLWFTEERLAFNGNTGSEISTYLKIGRVKLRLYKRTVKKMKNRIIKIGTKHTTGKTIRIETPTQIIRVSDDFNFKFPQLMRSTKGIVEYELINATKTNRLEYLTGKSEEDAKWKWNSVDGNFLVLEFRPKVIAGDTVALITRFNLGYGFWYSANMVPMPGDSVRKHIFQGSWGFQQSLDEPYGGDVLYQGFLGLVQKNSQRTIEMAYNLGSRHINDPKGLTLVTTHGLNPEEKADVSNITPPERPIVEGIDFIVLDDLWVGPFKKTTRPISMIFRDGQIVNKLYREGNYLKFEF